MRARAAEQRGSERAAAGVIAPKAAICLMLAGKLYEQSAIAVTIEALDGDAGAEQTAEPLVAAACVGEQAAGQWAGRPRPAVGVGDHAEQSLERDGAAAAAGSRRLVVRVEVPARGTRLMQIAGLLAELDLDVTSGSVAANGKLAKETFHVDYHGALSPEALALTLRAKLHETLQLSVIRTGDSIEASRTRPFTIHATASGAAATVSGEMATVAGGEGVGAASPEAMPDASLALLDLRAFGAMLASEENLERELWLRYLQVRAPDLLTCLTQAVTPPPPPPAPLTAERWLSEIRGFMLLRWRRGIGGPHLQDGVQMRDLQLGPMLGEGAYGQVYLARHRVLPDRWYAVKRQQLDVSMQTSRQGKHQLRLLEREHEVLLLLARESRGKADINLFVQLVAHSEDAACLQLAMTAVLGGELFHLLQETGAMNELEVQFYAGNLVMALQHLHSRGIAYRCVRPMRECPRRCLMREGPRCCRGACERGGGSPPSHATWPSRHSPPRARPLRPHLAAT